MLEQLQCTTLYSKNNQRLKSLLKGKKQLEIWGKAQRESARRLKSDWGKFRGVKFPR